MKIPEKTEDVLKRLGTTPEKMAYHVQFAKVVYNDGGLLNVDSTPSQIMEQFVMIGGDYRNPQCSVLKAHTEDLKGWNGFGGDNVQFYRLSTLARVFAPESGSMLDKYLKEAVVGDEFKNYPYENKH